MKVHREDTLYINAQAVLDNNASLMAYGIAMDLIMLEWWPTKSPFVFDEDRLAVRLSEALPERGYTEKVLRKHRDEIQSFFTILEDGRWAPNPQYLSVSNPNMESQY